MGQINFLFAKALKNERTRKRDKLFISGENSEFLCWLFRAKGISFALNIYFMVDANDELTIYR